MAEPSSIQFSGLNPEEVTAAREKFGLNELEKDGVSPIRRAIRDLVREPMFLLLLAASILYFISGQTGEGIFMLVAIV